MNFDPVEAHEQAGERPALVLSIDAFNRSQAALVIMAPITSRDKGILYHVPIDPPEGGVRKRSYIKCEDIRSVSITRLKRCWGTVSPETMAAVEYRLRALMDL